MKLLPHLPAYETQDLRPLTIVLAGLGLLLGVILSLAVVAGILYWQRPASRPVPAIETQRLRAGPRLEIDSGRDAQTLQQEAFRRLQGYGWTDHGTGEAHIPIERAMQLLARQGWPDNGPGGKKP